MSLSSTMNTAKNILSNSSTQSLVVSKNVANSENVGYAKRSAVTVTNAQGNSSVVSIRAADPQLQSAMIDGQSQASGQSALNTGLEQLRALLGGNDYDMAPGTYVGKLRDALQSYATQPSEITLGQTVVSAAQDVANSITRTSSEIGQVRAQADNAIANGVDKLNDLLSQFQTVNQSVVLTTAKNGDPNDALDARDKLVSEISDIVGVHTFEHANGDMALYTSDGSVLFDKLPRAVTFVPINGYGAGTVGNSVYIDGVPQKAGVGGNTTARGLIAANLQIRDDIAPQFGQQLDETARGLITMFSETDPSGTQSPMPGLFTWSGGTTEDGGTLVPGMSASFQVNPAVTSGNPQLLRDGGINGASYVWNTDSSGSYSKLLDSYVSKFDQDMTFDGTAGLGTTGTVLNYASKASGWLEAYRSTADASGESKAALSQRATEAYQNVTGVSLDEELSKMLDIEQSYKASTKLMNTVDDMLKSLLEIA